LPASPSSAHAPRPVLHSAAASSPEAIGPCRPSVVRRCRASRCSFADVLTNELVPPPTSSSTRQSSIPRSSVHPPTAPRASTLLSTQQRLRQRSVGRTDGAGYHLWIRTDLPVSVEAHGGARTTSIGRSPRSTPLAGYLMLVSSASIESSNGRQRSSPSRNTFWNARPAWPDAPRPELG